MEVVGLLEAGLERGRLGSVGVVEDLLLGVLHGVHLGSKVIGGTLDNILVEGGLVVERVERRAGSGHLSLDHLLGTLELGELVAESTRHLVDLLKILHLTLKLGLEDTLLLLLLEVRLLLLKRAELGLLFTETVASLLGFLDVLLELLHVVLDLLDLGIILGVGVIFRSGRGGGGRRRVTEGDHIGSSLNLGETGFLGGLGLVGKDGGNIRSRVETFGEGVGGLLMEGGGRV